VLAAKLDSRTESAEEIVRWVSEKVLQCYRNGITTGQRALPLSVRDRAAAEVLEQTFKLLVAASSPLN